MSGARLPAHLEVAGLIRAAEAAGGFGTVVAKGERDAGTILILTMERGHGIRLWERMPRLDGGRQFEVVREKTENDAGEFDAYLARRTERDRDIWLVELDVAQAERLVAEFSH